MTLNQWSNILGGSFQDLWIGVVKIVPNIIVAILVVLIGWLVGALIGRVVMQIIKSLKIDLALRRAGVEDVVQRGGMNLNSGAFIGGLVKWFIIVAFLVAAFDILGLTQVTAILQQFVLVYIPKVIVAVLVLMIGGVLADVVGKAVKSSARAADFAHASFLESISRWAIWVFAILVALLQLNIAEQFLLTLFTGFVGALALALGLSFGLGGRDAAKDIIEKTRIEIARKK